MVKRVSFVILISILTAAMACSLFVTGPRGVLVHAAETSVPYEESAVMDDLKDATVDGKPFALADYPAKAGADPALLLFTEYCYSPDPAKAEDLGLYVYIYNPGGLTFDVSQAGSTYFNKIQLAVGERTGALYRKNSLIYLNRSTAADGCDGRFYKFKVSLGTYAREEIFKAFEESEKRTYKISGFELRDPAFFNATEYEVSQSYTFTGYVKGYGPGALEESTLRCTLDALETVKLNVGHTFYRTKTSELGGGYQKQLNTVYFSVPKRFFDTFGTLQRIKAEWYEYKTKPIVVTSDETFYNAALPYVGKTLNNGGTQPYDSAIGYGIGGSMETQSSFGSPLYSFQGFNWNISPVLDSDYTVDNKDKIIEKLVYLLPTKDWRDIDSYDPLTDYSYLFGRKGNALLEYIYDYTPKSADPGGSGGGGFGGGGGRDFDESEDAPGIEAIADMGNETPTVEVKGGTLPAELFEDDIDASRKIDNASGKIQKGYSYYDFDASLDLQLLETWSGTRHTFWDTWEAFGFWDALLDRVPNEATKAAAPIYVLSDSDMSVSNEAIIDNLLINAKDVDAIRTAYAQAANNDEYLVLFRFAASDYYSEAAAIVKYGLVSSNTYGCAYIAQESVFLDFDIIQLTFVKEDVVTIVPAVSSPIDIVDDPTPPTDMPPKSETINWKKALAIALTVILVVVVGILVYKVIKNRSNNL